MAFDYIGLRSALVFYYEKDKAYCKHLCYLYRNIFTGETQARMIGVHKETVRDWHLEGASLENANKK